MVGREDSREALLVRKEAVDETRLASGHVGQSVAVMIGEAPLHIIDPVPQLIDRQMICP